MKPDRETPATFSPEETEQIRKMITTPDTPIACPRCGGELTSGTAVQPGPGGSKVWEIECPECHRCIMLQPIRPS